MTALAAAALQPGLLCTFRHSSAESYTLHTWQDSHFCVSEGCDKVFT